MIDLIYYGTGGYETLSRKAKYKVLLPEFSKDSYEFPGIYNFSSNGKNIILIHMQITDIDPDYDLTTVGDLRDVILKPVDFNLEHVIPIQQGEDALNYKEEINIIVYHDDKFILSKAIEYFFKKDPFESKEKHFIRSKTTPKKSGFGTLKPVI